MVRQNITKENDGYCRTLRAITNFSGLKFRHFLFRPTGYNFSVDIPAKATNLVFIGHSEKDTITSIVLYEVALMDMSCGELFADSAYFSFLF